MYTVPSISDFTTYFVRDFPYDPTGADLSKVVDADITKAIADASFNVNESLFSSQAAYSSAYLNLAAHYLVMNLRASSQGVADAYSWLTASKTVGPVSETFQFPQRILDNPILAMFTKTSYGAKYLSLVLPLLAGQAFSVCGGTSP